MKEYFVTGHSVLFIMGHSVLRDSQICRLVSTGVRQPHTIQIVRAHTRDLTMAAAAPGIKVFFSFGHATPENILSVSNADDRRTSNAYQKLVHVSCSLLSA